MPIDADRPITGKSEDRFHRHAFAAQIAKLALSLPQGQNFVLGVTGAWGGGKTSVLQMVEEEVAGRPDFLVLQFNPWLFSGAQDLVSDFFREIAAQLIERGAANPAASKLGEALSTLGKYLSPVGKVTGAIATAAGWVVGGPLGAAAVGAISELAGAEGDRRKAASAAAAPTSLRAQRKKIAEQLLVADFKLMVTIDDIDRLHEAEIREVMRLVRLTADFPNMIYMLAFDRARVEAALGQDKGYGQVYLEKIFQALFELPAITQGDLLGLLRAEVNTILNSRDHIALDDEYLQNVFALGVVPLFMQPREVKRYVNALNFAFDCLGGEVAAADIIGMEALRVQAPAVFAALPGAAALLVENGMEASAQLDAIRALAGDQVEQVRELLSRMFPRVQRYTKNLHYDGETARRWRKDRRVAHPEVFHLYYVQTVPADGISQTALSTVVEALGDEKRLKDALCTVDAARLGALFYRLEDYTDDCQEEAVAVAVPTLLNESSRIVSAPSDFFGRDFAVSRVVLRLVRRIENEGERTATVISILPKIELLSDRLLLFRLCRQDGGQGLVNAAGEAALGSHLREAIVAATSEQLAREPDLFSLAWLLQEASAEDRERVFAIVEHHPDVFVRFLESSVSHGSVRTAGSVVSHATATLPWTDFEQLFGKERLERVVREAASLQDDASRSSAEHKAIRLAVKYAGGWRPKRVSTGNDEGPAEESSPAPNSETRADGRAAGRSGDTAKSGDTKEAASGAPPMAVRPSETEEPPPSPDE